MIYLYPPGTKDLSQGGLPLFEAKDDRIIEVLNGRYDLSFKYPVEGQINLKKELEDFSIVGADTPRHGVQPFVVMRPIKRDGYWHIEAKHVFFLLEVFSTGQVWASGPASRLMQDIRVNSDNPDVFTFASNVLRRISVRYEGGPVMGILCEGEESILAQARGQLERDGYHVAIKDRIGEDTEYLLAQRKNINDTELVKDYSKIVTRLNVSKEIDHEKFIPRPNGEGKLTEPYPKTGGATLRVRYWDGTTGQLIEDGEGTFQVYDSNGYSIIGGMQTGSKRSIVTWRDKKKKYEETLEKDRERIKSLEERQTKNKENLKKQQGERTELANKYNSNKTESNRKRLESKDRAIENTNKSIKSTNEQLAKTKEKIAEYEKLLEGVPTVILGERKLDNVLAAGQYFIRMVKPAEGYLMDHTVKRFYSDSSKEIVIDFHSNPTEYPEDDTIRVETTVDSPIINEYPYVFTRNVELDDETMEVWKKDQPWILNFNATQQNLYNWAYEEFLLTRMDLPSEAFSFTAGSEVVSSGIGLGDTAVVHFSDYDLYKDLPVTEIEYSPMEQKYRFIRFGDTEDSFFSSMRSSMGSRISSAEKRLEKNISTVQRDSYDTAKTQANEVLKNTADMMDYKDLESYFESEYIKQGLMEYVDKVGADNISKFEVEMLHMTLFQEELEAKYGTLEERNARVEETARKMMEDIENEKRLTREELILAKEESEKARTESQAAKEKAEQARQDAQGAVEESKRSIEALKSEMVGWDLTGDGRNYFAIKFLEGGVADIYVGPETKGDRWFTVGNGADASGKYGNIIYVRVLAFEPSTGNYKDVGYITGEEPLKFQVKDGVDRFSIMLMSSVDVEKVKNGTAKIMVNRGREQLPWQPHYLDVEAGLYDVKTEITKARDYIETSVKDINGDISSVKLTAKSISEKVSNLDGQVAVVEKTAKDVSTRVTDLSGQYTEIKASVEGVETQVGNLEGEVSTAKMTANSASSKVSTLDGKVSSISQTVSGFSSRITNAEGKVNTMESTVDRYSSRIADVETGFSSLERTVSGLTSTVSGKASTSQVNQVDNRITAMVNSGTSRVWDSGLGKWVDKPSNSDARAIFDMVAENIQIKAPTIDLSGYVTFTDLAQTRGSTIIHGSRIKTGTISADRIGTGYLTSRKEYDTSSGTGGATSWINLDTGEFSFMNGALYHNGKTYNRGELWCTSSFAIAYPGTSTRMCEFNAGGLYFFNKYENKVGLITAAGSAMNYNNPSGGGVVFRIGSTGRLYMSNQVNRMGWSGIGSSFKTLLNGDVYINGDLHVGGGVGQNKGKF